MDDLEQWKLDLENYYRNQFFMDPQHKDDWQEAARQAAEAQYQAELGKRPTLVDLPEVTVTASNPTKTVTTESDWDPGYSQFMSGERYYADQDHKNYLDLQRNDMTNSIRETTDKWGKGIGLGMTALATLPVASGAAAGISTGVNAFKTAYPALYSGIKTGLNVGFTIDGVRNALSDNGVQKTYRIGKDIYQNGLTGQKAWNFAKSATGDVLDIAGGVGLTKDVVKGANYINNLYKSGKLRGLTDEAKYGIYDKIQGYRIYKNMPDASDIYTYKPYHPSHNTAVDDIYTVRGKQRQGLALTETEAKIAADTPITSGISDFDNGTYQTLSTQWSGNPHADMAFMGSYGHTRVGGETGRQWRMGFSTTPGKKLPRSFVEAQRQAIAHAPSGSFISADSHHLTIPEQIEFIRKIDPKTSIREGIKSADDWTFTTTPYGMSPDAYRFFTLQGQLPGNRLVYAGKTGLFNEYAVRNADVYNWQQAYRNGDMSAKQYVDNFNNWVKEFGGRPGHVDFKTGEPFFYHPVIYKNKSGGSINIKKRNKGKFSKVRDYVDYKNNK